jgi:hypothetical protein
LFRPHVVVDLIDGDDCLYNVKYHYLRTWLFLRHQSTLVALHDARKRELETGIKNTEIDALFRLIMQDLQICNVDDLRRSTAHKYIHKMRERALREDKTLSLPEIKKRERLYIDLLSEIDESFLQTLLMKANTLLMQKLASHSERGALQIIGMGSARQTYKFDMSSKRRHRTGSMFKDLFHITKELRRETKTVVLQTLTMPDITASLPNGENFRRVFTNYQGGHAAYCGDTSKLTLLYAHIHDIARRYPLAELTINFYDNDANIIAGLVKTFRRLPELIPMQATLVIHPYDGKFGKKKIFPGAGPRDENYQHNVRCMLVEAKRNSRIRIIKDINVVKQVDLPKFLATRDCNLAANQESPANCLRLSEMFGENKSLVNAEFEELVECSRRLYHLHHQDCMRFFQLAKPEKELPQMKRSFTY